MHTTADTNEHEVRGTARASGALMSSRTVGGLNRARVLRTLVDHGPLSRSDLARLAGVSRATIGTIVQGLLDEGVLEELESLDLGGIGKPARPLWFPAGAGSVIAVEVCRDAVRAALVDAGGEMTDPVRCALTQPRSADAVVAAAQRAVSQVQTDEARKVIGIGISVPGTCDTEAGVVTGSAQVPGAAGSVLVEALGGNDVPALVENDSRAQALAEQWFGVGRGQRTFTSVQTGEGLGVGLVLNGTVYRGPRGASGELGHTTVVMDGRRCRCGLKGCWETIATLPWLRSEARRRGIKGAARVDCARLTALAAAGDQAAGELLAVYADHLAVGLGNLTRILATERFVLHGDTVGGGDAFRVRVQEALFRRADTQAEVILTELGDRAALLGAAAAVLSEKLHVVS